jgi:hypothetical protein
MASSLRSLAMTMRRFEPERMRAGGRRSMTPLAASPLAIYRNMCATYFNSVTHRGPRRRDAVKRLRRSCASLRRLRRDCVSTARQSGYHVPLVRDAAGWPRSLTKRTWWQTAIDARSGQGRRSRSHGRMLRIRLDLTASTAMAARR